ncbi:MAG: preprotein translocase subunit SecE [Nitratiruptor sp.]|nr:preprotein translocase subunit SecE [Nitratiruptor sp.]NPA83348.1 preprotein translocase subunit SecE [Campylobacterota bacterium]
MEQIINYIREARLELQKVIFPTKEQVKNAYIAVFLVVTVVALFLALVDGTMSFILSHIID